MADIQDVFFLNTDGSVVGLIWNGGASAQTVTVKDQSGGGGYTSLTLNSLDLATVVFKNPATVNAPDAPTISAVPASATSITISLVKAGSNNGGAITGYDIWTGTTSAAETLLASNVTLPYTATGLATNTTQYLYAKARNSAGAGAASAELQIPLSSSPNAPPPHFLGMPGAAGRAYVTANTSPDISTGFADIQTWVNFTSYVGGSTSNYNSFILSRYNDASASAANSEWFFGLDGLGGLARISHQTD